MRWSVVVEAVGDREVSREEIVELADAVAQWGGIASGMGTDSYSAQLIVEADESAEATELAKKMLASAAETAGLPVWPITDIDIISEAEDDEKGLYE